MTDQPIVRIRPAGPDDAATVAEIWRAGWREAHLGRVPAELVAAQTADDAIVLRTLLIWHINRDYRYNVQRADNLRAWFAQPWVGNVYHVTYERPPADPVPRPTCCSATR